MTYASFLRKYVGKKGRLIPTQGTWLFRLAEHENGVLSEVYEGFVIFSIDHKEGRYRRVIPNTLLSLED
jgi:hypothetical protein